MSSRAQSGTIIEGKFRLERELGAGGMGAVWLATQVTVDRKVAVKLLHPAFLDQEELQQRFEVEAKAIARLNHPNCITLYDFGFSNTLGAYYTVIEYIDGVSLDKKLGAPMALPEALRIIRSVALALDHAHHKGILHRDLKPENIMIGRTEDGQEITKVLDFGIARMMKGDSSEESHRITKAGEVFGTPAYMSPEQARSIRQVTPAADLYSVGVMFYELLEGRLPFFANSAFDLLMMHVTKPVPPMMRMDIPDEVKQTIYKLLEKEPEKRFQSGRELVEQLDRAFQVEFTGSYPQQLSPSTSQELPAMRLPTPQPTLMASPGPIAVNDVRQTNTVRDAQFTTNVDVGGKKGAFLLLAIFAAIIVVAGIVYALIPANDASATIAEPDPQEVVQQEPEQQEPELEPTEEPVAIVEAIPDVAVDVAVPDPVEEPIEPQVEPENIVPAVVETVETKPKTKVKKTVKKTTTATKTKSTDTTTTTPTTSTKTTKTKSSDSPFPSLRLNDEKKPAFPSHSP